MDSRGIRCRLIRETASGTSPSISTMHGHCTPFFCVAHTSRCGVAQMDEYTVSQRDKRRVKSQGSIAQHGQSGHRQVVIYHPVALSISLPIPMARQFTPSLTAKPRLVKPRTCAAVGLLVDQHADQVQRLECPRPQPTMAQCPQTLIHRPHRPPTTGRQNRLERGEVGLPWPPLCSDDHAARRRLDPLSTHTPPAQYTQQHHTPLFRTLYASPRHERACTAMKMDVSAGPAYLSQEVHVQVGHDHVLTRRQPLLPPAHPLLIIRIRHLHPIPSIHARLSKQALEMPA